MNLDRKNENDPAPIKSKHPNWEIFAIGILVAVSFTVFFIAGYAIWIKCHGQ